MKLWILLENNPALLQRGWLPPEKLCPELAGLRAEHQRLLTVVREETAAAHAIKKQFEAEDAERGERLSQAFRGNGDPGPDDRQPEEQRSTELADATLRVEAATDAGAVPHSEAQPVACRGSLVRVEPREGNGEIVSVRMARIGSARLSVLGTRAGTTRTIQPISRNVNASVPRQRTRPVRYAMLPTPRAPSRILPAVALSSADTIRRTAMPPAAAATPPLTIRTSKLLEAGRASGLARNPSTAIAMNNT